MEESLLGPFKVRPVWVEFATGVIFLIRCAFQISGITWGKYYAIAPSNHMIILWASAFIASLQQTA
eukprot:730-Chlamydomonas_euryale.AAC.3